MRTLSYVLGTGLLAVGLALLLGVGALYAYGAYERIRFERDLALTPTVAVPPGVARAEEVDTPTPAPTPTVATTPRTTSIPSPTATATPRPTPTPTPVILPARRVIIPKIDLDSPVVESLIKDGQWQVPKFVAGHLQGTANPGEKGNVVLAGHVESISSGNVFAEIDRLKPGDRITLVTQAAGFEYVVREKLVVKNDDLSVVAPTSEETLTLITCTGTFIPAIRDFDQRLVVVARRAPETRQVKPSARGGT